MTPNRKFLARLALCAVLMAFIHLLPAIEAQAAWPEATNPLTCEGYPEPRIFLDAQAWWTPALGQAGEDFGHIHNATCAPHRQTLRGLVDFDIRLILHNNPGVVNELNVWVRYQGSYLPLYRRFNLDWQCPVNKTCERWEHIQVDTRLIPTDGIRDFKIEVFVREPNGMRLATLNYFRAYIENGHLTDTQFTDYKTRAGAYWKQFSYSNAYWLSDLPITPIAGEFRFTALFESKRVERDATAVRYDVLLDANFHAGIPGTVIAQGEGNFLGEITLDTTQLANGPHRLTLRTHSDDGDFGSTLTGVLVVPFAVNNAGGSLPSPTFTPPFNATATHPVLTHPPTITGSPSVTPTATATPSFVYTLVSPKTSLTPCATANYASPIPITRSPDSSLNSVGACAVSHTYEPPLPLP